MFNNTVCVIYDKDIHYSSDHRFLPEKKYPEYPYDIEAIDKSNTVYSMIREAFHLQHLDDGNYNTDKWNPLGQYISPGQHVLLKPNLVLHFNGSGMGMSCLITNVTVVAAVVDYVVIALKGEGQIIIGDAPIQDCDFDKLVKENGYGDLIKEYGSRGVKLILRDFRNTKAHDVGGVYAADQRITEHGSKDNGIVVQLDRDSAFSGLSEEHLERLRVTNYDPRIMGKHHNALKHEYKIAKDIIDADVIINLPKPKTHRKAGITAALKNLIGINANKEYLPHHTIGSKDENGDAYLHQNDKLSAANRILDHINMLEFNGEYDKAKSEIQNYYELVEKGRKEINEKYWEGSWSGNDTIWRTIVDLNKILIYADKNGIMRETEQRKVFTVADMIISGELTGPLEPSPVNTSMIICGDSPVLIDKTICSIMGFDYNDIPTLAYDEYYETDKFYISASDKPIVVSNSEHYEGKDLKKIFDEKIFRFSPAYGWEKALGGSYYFENLKSEISNTKSGVYIFGAGGNAWRVKNKLVEWNVKIKAFLDNDSNNHKKSILGLDCIFPEEGDRNLHVVVSVSGIYVDTIIKQLTNIGYNKVYIMSTGTEI